ncbi:hypothetical protein GCM10022240_25950 [Microbacterium kribbense]|uniref:Uncharacterized protein n=1 Tax=Microbacterium kribbense TaxID=433645 RepID=A0ABP7GUD1_9MICO
MRIFIGVLPEGGGTEGIHVVGTSELRRLPANLLESNPTTLAADLNPHEINQAVTDGAVHVVSQNSSNPTVTAINP